MGTRGTFASYRCDGLVDLDFVSGTGVVLVRSETRL